MMMHVDELMMVYDGVPAHSFAPVCNLLNMPYCGRWIGHVDFDVRGSTFHSVQTHRCTRVTDLNSVVQSTQRTFDCGVFTSLIKSVCKAFAREGCPTSTFSARPRGVGVNEEPGDAIILRSLY
ncbi:hypothetical protein TNCV_1029171 [Trichonephila clavipes]|nr:hypothetical protein TNCV_1029171 [Trichonephila clavipes]